MALGAGAGNDGLVAADVTDEAFFGAMISDGDGAVCAFAGVAAGRAGEGAGKASAVKEEDDLVSGSELLFHGVAKTLGQDGRASFFRFVTHVDDTNEGEGLTVGALGEGDELVFSCWGLAFSFLWICFFKGGDGVEEAFDGGGGGAEDDGGFFEVGADDGEVASVIFRWVFLFVSSLVLFVDEDKAEVGEGGKDGGAGSNDDASSAFANTMPFVEALSLSESGV